MEVIKFERKEDTIRIDQIEAKLGKIGIKNQKQLSKTSFNTIKEASNEYSESIDVYIE